MSGIFATLFMATSAVSTTSYENAARFLPWNVNSYVRNAQTDHHWIDGKERLWFRQANSDGTVEFIVFDAKTRRSTPAFNHQAVAEGLSNVTGARVEAERLPFFTFRYAQNEAAIRFRYSGKQWICATNAANCQHLGQKPDTTQSTKSPDGKWLAELRGDNLWLIPTDGGTALPLSSDGTPDDSFSGTRSSFNFISKSRSAKQPYLIWSKDSRYIITYKTDESGVLPTYLVQSTSNSGSPRPGIHSFRYAMPGDREIAKVRPVIFDVVRGKRHDFPAYPTNAPYDSPIATRYLWWDNERNKAYLVQRDRFSRSVSLIELDPKTGSSTTKYVERSDTWIRTNGNTGIWEEPAVRVLQNGDIIWWSERDGWGHLYLIDGETKEVKTQLTHGHWIVRSIVRIDEARGLIFFLGSGKEPGPSPYSQYLYSARLDGTELKLLTPEEGSHAPDALAPQPLLGNADEDVTELDERARFSASGSYFIDTFSSPNLPPKTVVRDFQGALICELSRADASAVAKMGIPDVIRFKATAADGKSIVYGSLFRPSNFDPDKRYPVINSVYPGPQIIRTQQTYVGALFDPLQAQSLAELGFVVITIDGRGTPHSSHSFSDHSYGRLDRASDLDDHVKAIQQLSERYNFIDINRVGIWGPSGGGFASTLAMLRYPEFFKVGVSAVGSHDQAGYIAHWGETYIGPNNPLGYSLSNNRSLARNLRGKLLIMAGELDDNVSPTLTIGLAAELIKENKDFDLLIMPGEGHGAFLNPYFIKRMWDFFVRNLLQSDPPTNVSLIRGEGVKP